MRRFNSQSHTRRFKLKRVKNNHRRLRILFVEHKGRIISRRGASALLAPIERLHRSND